MINLDDDDEIAKIDEELQNELNLIVSTSMNSNGGNCDDPSHGSDPPHVELSDSDVPSMTLFVVPIASYLPFIYD